MKVSNFSYEDDDYEEDDQDEVTAADPYTQRASSEFRDSEPSSSSSLAFLNEDGMITGMDWGGALGKLRQRMEDTESGLAQDPSHVLFRVMSSQTPNQMIGQFVQGANPQTIQAMSGAVGSLLGGLSNPTSGIETVVRASGEKIGSLCFQLQMTGYMFRNAEYVLALKDILDIKGKAGIQSYKKAFQKLDKDGSGYIEVSEIQELFDDVYDGNAPRFETEAFLKFFDQNDDGRISWDEFESGLGDAFARQLEKGNSAARLLQTMDDEDDDEEDDPIEINTNVYGTIEIELEDGNIVQVDAKEYMDSLQKEAQSLKEELQREKGLEEEEEVEEVSSDAFGLMQTRSSGMDIAGYIASREGDVKNLTEGISPEVVETMKKLVNFVLEGGDGGNGKKELTDQEKAEMEMELPGAALQQLSLWQLVLGYRLREAEVKGDHMDLLQ